MPDVLVARLSLEVAGHALRLVVAASYERRGSLFAFLDDGVEPSEIVPDHANRNRAAKSVRETLAGVSIGHEVHRKLLHAATRIDGAILLDNRGAVIDVACMVAEPSAQALAAAGLSRLERFPGARSTAAWNASVSGLAIKVSDDGPVDAIDHGVHVFHAG